MTDNILKNLIESYSSDVKYEDINNKFIKGTYNKTEIIIFNKNSFFNITQLCNNNEIKFDDIKNKTKYKELIIYIEKHYRTKSIFEYKDNTKNSILNGFYLHPFMGSYILNFFENNLDIKKIIDDYKNFYFLKNIRIIYEDNKKNKEEMNNKENNIKEFKEFIDKVNSNFDSLSEMLNKNKKVLSKYLDQNYQKEKPYIFIIFKFFKDSDKNKPRYYLIKRNKRSLEQCKRLLISDYKDIIEFLKFEFENIEKLKEFFNKFKFKLSKDLSLKNNVFKLLKTTTEDNIIKTLNKIFSDMNNDNVLYEHTDSEDDDVKNKNDDDEYY